MLMDNHDADMYHFSGGLQVQPAPLCPAMAEAESGILGKTKLPQQLDENAFCEFYREVGPTLWSYIRRTSGDAALADDILQETFYRFLRADLPALEKFQTKAYLYRIA